MIFLTAVFFLTTTIACKKYREATPIANAAYLRVYNDIPFFVDAFHSSATIPFLTFLYDPQQDNQGVSQSAPIVGDFLATREPFSSSISINAGNSLKSGDSTYAKNYDYPGILHVPTAPIINGFDLSGWAQVPSGKHHIVFVQRPLTDTPFTKLSSAIRARKIIDTTVDLKPGEVYTMEVVTLDQIKGKYGIYLRQETFIHESFDSTQIYVNFFNLSGSYDTSLASDVPPFSNGSPQSNYFSAYPLSITSSYGYGFNLVQNGASYIIPGGGFFGVLSDHFAATAPYATFRAVPSSYLYDMNGNFDVFSTPQPCPSCGPGTLPWITFGLISTATSGKTVGTNVTLNVSQNQINNFYLTGNYTFYGSNINLASANYYEVQGGRFRVVPTVNILEIVYDHVYQIQIVPASLKL